MRFRIVVSNQKLRRNNGVTLIESLVALSVLAVICAVAFPHFSNVRQSTLIASRSAELASLFQLAQSRAISENQAYYLYLQRNEHIQCIIASYSEHKGAAANQESVTPLINCQQTVSPMVRIPEKIALQKKVSKGWEPLPEGELFEIDFRTQRPNLNLTLGLGANQTSSPDYIVMVRQYLGFRACQRVRDDNACG
ncbi:MULTISPECIES: Tfp pilus assembly protein FimT/FimU [unclassified Salinivibrio]|uniref:pilus assembly FimT family protein n=1 Tax=unclassified Salinivibrio TaxID=2636825 RepID=UPI00128C6BFE|nr:MULTISPECIES: prepilin-type N-terminal cleavage/methylation domain-containing protein [unclassified Salinivibrio]MPS33515.1 prepilin-type N-terminal cleavage/methylation domain-containing protein [Salinivibrio sp. VYel7]MPX94899.1 prepilin-type N-terminal cleavage/methylation domain-containing protein [Salinivibrio sp. VYel9]MPX97893.1 prepilin-type N-terminal cleavage/methylation domain-containing protein [Salinivibrio sp. VYel6]MPY01129.1 prepilin-type N-terminal cleavage/methylation domai